MKKIVLIIVVIFFIISINFYIRTKPMRDINKFYNEHIEEANELFKMN